MTVLGFVLTFGVLAVFLVASYRQIRRVDDIVAESDARRSGSGDGDE